MADVGVVEVVVCTHNAIFKADADTHPAYEFFDFYPPTGLAG